MYTPFVRDKQNEILALLSLPKFVFKLDNIIPIIEPVTDISKQKNLAKIAENNIPFILVTNPSVGKNSSLKVNQDIKVKFVEQILADYHNFWVGFIISSKTTIDDIKMFFKQFPKNYKALIHDFNFKDIKQLLSLCLNEPSLQFNIFIEGHTSLTYRGEFSDIEAYDIIIRDGFKKQKNNALYPSEDYFSDLHLTYDQTGYDGFGDYQMIGYHYQDDGGPAHAVAIHFSSIDSSDSSIVMNHFVSDNITGPIDPGGKFLEALKKLHSYLQKNPQYETAGVEEYKKLYKSKHFPGLGVVKRLSIMHHIELIHSLL